MHLTSDYTLVKLANGTWSVHSKDHKETFHPVIGPSAEAEALYVRQLRLPRRMAEASPFVLWDVGLGAAANVLTVLHACSQIPSCVKVVSFDHTTAPLEFALQHTRELGYFHHYADACETLVRDRSLRFQNGAMEVEWELRLGDFPSLLAGATAGSLPAPRAILFDAFSPAKNPAMWSLPLFRSLHARLDPLVPCTLPTYSRSTLLRVTLLLAGFFVGSGHATGEKEETTIAANQQELLDSPLDRSWLERVKRSTSAEPLGGNVYRQAPPSPATLEALHRHPQFVL